MFCVSDPVLLTSSLGVLSVLLIRWESLPEDIKMTQDVLQWLSKNIALFCKARYKVNECMNCTEHFPRPPRTPVFPKPVECKPDDDSDDLVDENTSEETEQNEEENDENDEKDEEDENEDEKEKEVQLQSNSI